MSVKNIVKTAVERCNHVPRVPLCEPCIEHAMRASYAAGARKARLDAVETMTQVVIGAFDGYYAQKLESPPPEEEHPLLLEYAARIFRQASATVRALGETMARDLSGVSGFGPLATGLLEELDSRRRAREGETSSTAAQPAPTAPHVDPAKQEEGA